ncbi:MAG: L-histidine N(alpha)-methyltransferase [Betaproteobacteria bacterium]|nr:L-histidine N(alpha)-methyltransferase [Betaproteobacteria bacterium]
MAMHPHAGRAPFDFYDLHPGSENFLDDALAGLAQPRKALAPKYFYDARGSELFEAICELPEYYPTRTELAMMQAHARDMAHRLGPETLLIEYGAGSGRKTRVLIEALAPAAYVAIDISRSALTQCAAQLAAAYPAVKIAAVCADYSRPLELPRIDGISPRRRVIYFPGSTIGNFTRADALAFLRHAHALAGEGGAMLVGVDLKKDPARLHAAYNDAQGITAAFNLNLLARINRELNGDFNLAAFEHHAFYNQGKGRIEMHLKSRIEQTVNIAGRAFTFRAGETLHTENSCKYTIEEFQQLARQAGFTPEHSWCDEQRLFSVHYLGVGVVE